MSHPEFFELAFDASQLVSQAGWPRAAALCRGVGCPHNFFLSFHAAAGGAQKKEKKYLVPRRVPQTSRPRPRQEAAAPWPLRFWNFRFKSSG